MALVDLLCEEEGKLGTSLAVPILLVNYSCEFIAKGLFPSSSSSAFMIS